MRAARYNRVLRRGGGQGGFALLFALMMLLVLSVLAITTSDTATQQQKMATNVRENARALRAAEVGIRHAERWITVVATQNPTYPVDPANCSSPPCDVLVADELDPLADATWSGDQVREAPAVEGAAEPPKFFISELSSVDQSLNEGQKGDQAGRLFYRITARGVGGSGEAETVIQSTYATRQ